MRIAKLFVAVAIVLGGNAMASADILVDQTGTPWATWDGCDILRADSASKMVADDFTLAGASKIQGVVVQGHWGGSGWGETLNGFYVTVFGDNSGAPGTAVSTQHITSGWSGADDSYTIPLSDISVSSGTYWLGIQADITQEMGSGSFKLKAANGESDSYVASGSSSINLSDSTLNGRYLQLDVFGDGGWISETYTGSFPAEWTSGNNSHPQGLDLSFSVTGTTVPEPGSLALLGVSALGLLAYAWRKRK